MSGSNAHDWQNSSVDLRETLKVIFAAALLLPLPKAKSSLVCVCVSLQEVQLCSMGEELALKETRWLQLEAGLQSTVTSLEQELDLERERHSKEVQ